jgi:hypothetical protein
MTYFNGEYPIRYERTENKRDEVIMAVSIQISVFRNVTPCSSVDRYQHYRENNGLKFQSTQKSLIWL